MFSRSMFVSRSMRRGFSSMSHDRRKLMQLEERANANPLDAEAQNIFLRELNKVNPSLVRQRIESGNYSTNEGCFKEYMKALVASNRIDTTSVEELLRPIRGEAAARSNQLAYDPAHQQQQMYNSQFNQSYQNPYSSGSGFSSYFNPLAATAASSSATHSSSSRAMQSGSEHAPVFVKMVEPSLKSQIFKTMRLFAVGGLVLWFLAEQGGLPKSLSFTNEVQPATDQGKTFEDVKGCQEAKEELQEIVAYLRDPSSFTRLGGKLPKGVLLTGPPGTGKTLLAKAIAGEAGVPFFYASGSEFEEMFVGVGARRVRELFKAAKKYSPCIIFIDEIDAIGSRRALKEQQAMKMTLNQLLVELDGFEENEGVIIVGATNFPETLDPALVRPGRFDRNVVVPLPDVKGRREILSFYLRNIPTSPDVDIDIIARGTPGTSGADLANLINIAAIRASQRENSEAVTHADLEYARDKTLMGGERRSAIIPDDVKKLTAYHEGGHAIVALHTKGAMPIHKATIMPRGPALGIVFQLPEESDSLRQTKRQMLAELDVCMGGRVAEEIIFGSDDITSGASSDIRQATNIATAMVTKYGMSSEVGMIYLPSDKQESQTVGSSTQSVVDKEVKLLLEQSYSRATKLLTKHKKELHTLAAALLEHETLDLKEIETVLKGKKLTPA